MVLSLALSFVLTQMPPGHPQVDPSAKPPSGDELMEKLDQAEGLKDKDKTFEVAASVGRLYYAHGRYPEAATFLQQAVDKSAEVKAFYLSKKKALKGAAVPAPASVGCVPGEGAELEVLFKKAKEQKDPAAQVACARAALLPLMEVENQLGAVKFLVRDVEGALQVFERALELFESNAEARYSHAALVLDLRGDDVKQLAVAKSEFERFVADLPTSPRVPQAKAFLARIEAGISAGGISKIKPVQKVAKVDPHAGLQDGPPRLTPEMVEAVQNVERSPEMDQGYAKLVEEAEGHLAAHKYQDALDNYKRVVPFQTDNARARAGMAWSLVGLGKSMADNVWNVAAQNPEAIDQLGDSLKAKGDAEGAKGVWTKLAGTVPSYADKVRSKL